MEETITGEVPRRPHCGPGTKSTNLWDLLRDDDSSGTRNDHRGQHNETRTLATVLACEKQVLSSTSAATSGEPAGSISGGRTLLDVIRLDDDANRLVSTMLTIVRPAPPQHRISWKAFKSLLSLRRAATLPNSSSSTLNTATVDPATMLVEETTNIPSVSNVGLNWSVTIGEHVEAREPRILRNQREEPIRVPLMVLLEEADRSSGGGRGSSFATALLSMAEQEVDDEDEGGKIGDKEAVGETTKGGMYVCCVCMVRHKGTAFIPCGHTFCRLCSRELWVSRGSCPLCNGFILEILDIF